MVFIQLAYIHYKIEKMLVIQCVRTFSHMFDSYLGHCPNWLIEMIVFLHHRKNNNNKNTEWHLRDTVF